MDLNGRRGRTLGAALDALTAASAGAPPQRLPWSAGIELPEKLIRGHLPGT